MTTITRSSRGFTLIELLVAATIVIILSAIGFVSFSAAGKTARDGKRKADLEQVRAALEIYRSATGSYPQPSGTAQQKWAALMTNAFLYPNYISVNAVVDPKNDLVYYYTYVTPSPAGGVAGKTYRVAVTLLETTGATYFLDSP